jgi:hypothetical protein
VLLYRCRWSHQSFFCSNGHPRRSARFTRPPPYMSDPSQMHPTATILHLAPYQLSTSPYIDRFLLDIWSLHVTLQDTASLMHMPSFLTTHSRILSDPHLASWYIPHAQSANLSISCSSVCMNHYFVSPFYSPLLVSPRNYFDRIAHVCVHHQDTFLKESLGYASTCDDCFLIYKKKFADNGSIFWTGVHSSGERFFQLFLKPVPQSVSKNSRLQRM